METLAQLIRADRPAISDASIITYCFSLKKLHITERKDIEKLNAPDEILGEVSKLKLTQQRNLLSSVLVILRAAGKDKDLYEVYKKRCFELGAEYNAQQAKNEKTDKQETNWVKLSELKKITRKLVRTNPGDQQSLIAALYSYQPPSRLDYYKMKIINFESEIDDKNNFILIKNSRVKTFIFQDYKNSKHHNQVRVNVSKELNSVINKFLKLNPGRSFLLQNKKGEPLNRNQLGKLLPIVFKESGKNVTLNIIRHVYVSENVDIAAVTKYKQISDDMMHNPAQQIEYAKID